MTMGDFLRLRDLASSPRPPDSASYHRNDIDLMDGMDDRDSRAPLLGAPTSSDRNAPAPERDDGDDHGHTMGGVEQADAINLVWSRTSLILAYCFIFLCSFAEALQWQIISNLTPYVTSEFSSHSLIPTIGIVSSILSGVLKLPISKVIDAWGRPQGLASMIVLATIGLVLMALCDNVKTYAAAQVFYAVGLSGFQYILNIIVADTSSMKNRAMAFGFASTPNLITTFIGPPIATAFYERSSWRWAFGASAIMFLLLSIPILAILTFNTRKAVRLGLLSHEEDPKAPTRTVLRFLAEYDAIGIVLGTFGLTMMFVPFSLGVTADDERNIALLVIGVVFVVAFALHEKFTAEHPIVPFSLLFSRNVAGGCLMFVSLFVSYYSWDSYYSSYIQVVHGLSITEAGYIDHIYALGSCLWGMVAGYLIRVSDRYKWLAVIAAPVYILGGCLMILFRRPGTHVAFLVLCQVLMTIGGSTLITCDYMAVMTASSHGEVASVMAVLSLATYVGSACGNSLSGAIWNSVLPAALAELLPHLPAAELRHIASDMKKQLSYPMGSPVRDAIIIAYDRAQVRMCVAGTLTSLLLIVAVALWRDASVSETKQVKGKVL